MKSSKLDFEGDSWRHSNGINFAFSLVQLLEFKTETDNVYRNKLGEVVL